MWKIEWKEINYTPEQIEEYKSRNKTKTINDETDTEEYNLERRKKQFIDFCGQKRSLRKVRPGRLKLLNENGEQYASIQCKAWDCPEDETERDELWLENENGESKNDDFEFNKPYNYKFSFRIPENFPLSPTRLIIWQWKFNRLDNSDENKGPSPILAQRIKKIDWKYYLVITDSHREQIWEKIPFDDIKGKWVDMEYKIKFSDKEGVESSVEIMANIEWKKVNIFKWSYEIRDEENKLKLNPGKPHTWYFKFGLYRDSYDYAIKKLKKDSKLSRKEKKIWKQEIEKAQSSENETPMEIHFKGFSMEELNTNTEDIKQSRVEQENEAKKLTQKYLNWDTEDTKHLTRLLKQWDTMKVYSEFFKIDEKFKLAIENLKEPQTQKVYASLQFLMPDHRDYIDETQKEYQNLFNKVKNFNQNNILKVIEEKDINKIVDLKNQSKKLKSRLKKLKKYEKWEFINLPNWLSYEFCKKNEEDSIPNWINLWENDYFIKPHVSENYDLFIDSLLEIKQILKKNKWINIKYCKTTSWLMNIKFLRWYFWDQKPNIIKIFEQMEPACISFKLDEKNNAASQKNPHKNPLRFIKQPSKLYDYITNGHEDQFCEAEMWLDLDKLSNERQDEWISSTDENPEGQIKETISDSGQIEQEYAEVLVKLIWNNENFKELLEGKHELSIKDIENIYNALYEVIGNTKKEVLKKGEFSKEDFKNLRKFCFDPKAIEKYKIFNCSWWSLMMASIINKLWWQATIARVYHHVVCIAQIWNRQYLIDTINREWEDITWKWEITDTEYKGISKFTVKKPLLGRYTKWYIFESTEQGKKYIHGWNYEMMMTEKEYEKAYKEIRDLIGDKLDTYPKSWDKDFPKSTEKIDFPEFDKKIYEIEHDKLPKAWFFWKIKLKAQRFFLKLKQIFKKK